MHKRPSCVAKAKDIYKTMYNVAPRESVKRKPPATTEANTIDTKHTMMDVTLPEKPCKGSVCVFIAT